MKIKRNIVCFSLAFSLALPMVAFGETVPAPTGMEALLLSPQTNDRPIGRGEAVAQMVKTFGLEERNKEFLELCLNVPDECFFAFGAQSNFDGISFDPLVLYPDVPVANRFSSEINVATMLGLVRGFPEENTPFKPQANLLRIHALKMVFEAQDLIEWKEKFELFDEKDVPTPNLIHSISGKIPLSELFSSDFPEKIDDIWWCWRYISLSYELNIVPDAVRIRDFSSFFEPITLHEFDALLNKTQLLYADNQKTQS